MVHQRLLLVCFLDTNDIDASRSISIPLPSERPDAIGHVLRLVEMLFIPEATTATTDDNTHLDPPSPRKTS